MLQEDIEKLILEKNPKQVDLIKQFLSDIEDNRVSNNNASKRLLTEIENIAIKEGIKNDH